MEPTKCTRVACPIVVFLHSPLLAYFSIVFAENPAGHGVPLSHLLWLPPTALNDKNSRIFIAEASIFSLMFWAELHSNVEE